MRIQRQIQNSIMKKESGVELDEHIKKMKQGVPENDKHLPAIFEQNFPG